MSLKEKNRIYEVDTFFIEKNDSGDLSPTYLGLSNCDYCEESLIGHYGYLLLFYDFNQVLENMFLFCKSCAVSKSWKKQNIFREPMVTVVLCKTQDDLFGNPNFIHINQKYKYLKDFRSGVGGVSVFDGFSRKINSIIVTDNTRYAGREKGSWNGSQISSPEKVVEISEKVDSNLSIEEANKKIDEIKKWIPYRKTREYIEGKKKFDEEEERRKVNNFLHEARLKCYNQIKLLKSEDDIIKSKKNFSDFQKFIINFNPDEELKALEDYYSKNLYLPNNFVKFIGSGGLKIE